MKKMRKYVKKFITYLKKPSLEKNVMIIILAISLPIALLPYHIANFCWGVGDSINNIVNGEFKFIERKIDYNNSVIEFHLGEEIILEIPYEER